MNSGNRSGTNGSGEPVAQLTAFGPPRRRLTVLAEAASPQALRIGSHLRSAESLHALLEVEQGGAGLDLEPEPPEQPHEVVDLGVSGWCRQRVTAAPKAHDADEERHDAEQRDDYAGCDPGPWRLVLLLPGNAWPALARRAEDLLAQLRRKLVLRVAARGARDLADRRERSRLRRGRCLRRRRVERNPADSLEPDLDPGVGIEIAHHVLVRVCVERAGSEAARDAHRDAEHAQHQRRGAREVLAVAPLVLEQE